jgi:hypothetical protein
MDQWTPELLKDLEAFVIPYVKEHGQAEQGKNPTEWWTSGKAPWEIEEFMVHLDYDSNKLLQLYSMNLKKPRSNRYIQKKLKLDRMLSWKAVETCHEVLRILVKPQSKLPLLLNKTTGVAGATIKWRLTRGV